MWQKTRNFTCVITKLKNSIGGFNDLFPTTKEIMSRKSEKERRWREKVLTWDRLYLETKEEKHIQRKESRKR